MSPTIYNSWVLDFSNDARLPLKKAGQTGLLNARFDGFAFRAADHPPLV